MALLRGIWYKKIVSWSKIDMILRLIWRHISEESINLHWTGVFIMLKV